MQPISAATVRVHGIARPDASRGNLLVSTRFARQVVEARDRVAVECGDKQLTYCALDERSNRLANYLRRQGVGPEISVGINIERSIEMVVGLLGILKAGGAYLPLDPATPPARQALLLREARPPIILTQRHLTDRLPTGPSKLVCLDDEWAAIEDEPATAVVSEAHPDTLAYLPYTSGSSGPPKGVAILHRGIVNLVCDNDYATFGRDQVFLQLAPLAFDASTFEIWGALLHGARLVIAPPVTPTLPQLGTLLRERGITTLWLTAGLFHVMVQEQLEDLGCLHQLLAGGDVLAPAIVRTVRARFPSLRLINGYGPTETTTFACCHTVGELPADCNRVPIGRPIRGVEVVVLNDAQRPVAPGEEGELFIGGAGVARGYWNRPDLTARQFVSRRLGGLNTRMYRTGDRVRVRSNGELEFLGRLDRQVKLRGFRVEPAEVEAALLRHADVREAVVDVRPISGSDKGLVAYVVARPGCDAMALRDHLRTQMPEYSVPQSIISLDALPLNANGKVDLARLPAPQLTGSAAGAAPATLNEGLVQAIWADLLPVHSIGIDDDFFNLGGDSLLAMRLLSKLKRQFGRDIGAEALINGTTVRRLAALLDEPAAKTERQCIVLLQPGGDRPPFFFAHPVGGQVLGFRPLARHVGTDQPFFGIQACATARVENCRIEKLAADYVRSMRAVQPTGPYYLGGYSMGAFIALEMARQLRAAGEEVAFLAAVDDGPALLQQRPACSLGEWRMLLRNAPRWFVHRLTHQPPRQIVADVVRKFRVWARRGAGIRLADGVDLEEVLDVRQFGDHLRPTLVAHYSALKTYIPKSYSGQIHLFRARVQPLFGSHRSDLGWGAIVTGAVAIRVVPGYHDDLLIEPAVQELGRRLGEELRRAQAARPPARRRSARLKRPILTATPT